MSKFRPVPLDARYVIPDIHGNLELLKRVCDRIFPLRKSDGGKDFCVFLGDYIDRHVDSHLVIDYLIDLKNKYGDQTVFLMGNHELMMLYALDAFPGKSLTLQSKFQHFKMWYLNGGKETIFGYCQRAGLDDTAWMSIQPNRILDIIPKSHIEFFQSLRKSCEMEDYVFVHGGMDPYKSVYNQELDMVTWDRDLLEQVMNKIWAGEPQDWDKIIVTGHNVTIKTSNGKIAFNPIITEKFLMLDCGSPERLLLTELKSMQAFMAKPGQRLVKFELKETVKI